ncbi:MAG: iron hydrogenase small subunit, partial [Firmicutes bacterium]|nr:iron hydrogenase small subunit [Bacillota bacterium]
KKIDDFVRKKRINALYLKDEGLEARCAHQNPLVKKIYSEFLKTPLSDTSEMLLHTKFFDRSSEIK